MTRFFVDAFYWIALLSPRDQWHARVRVFNAALAAYHLYTTDELTISIDGSSEDRRSKTFTWKEMTRPGKYRIILYSVYMFLV